MKTRMVRGWRCALVATALAGATACASSPSASRPAPFPGSRPVAETPDAATPLPRPLADAVIASALDLLGTRYRLGGESPDTGFDCSGFVGYVLRQHAIDVPRTAAAQFAAGQSVDRADLQPGDLVFFSTTGPGPTHVGIVVSVQAPAEFIHAPADGSSVRVERYDSPYWARRWVGARRLF